MHVCFNLDKTLTQCLSAVENGEDVVITQEGTWYVRCWMMTALHHIFGINDALTLAENVHSTLRSRLFRQVDHGLTAVDGTTQKVMLRLIKATKKRLSNTAKVEQVAFQALEQRRHTLNPTVPEDLSKIIAINRRLKDPSTAPALQAKANLQCLQLSLENMPLSQDSIEKLPYDQQDFDWLIDRVQTWQERQFPYVDYIQGNPKKDAVLAKLALCCRYKKFIARCRKNEALLQAFLNAIIKNMPDESLDSVHLFMQMPDMIKLLQKANLDKRLREIANRGIRFVQRDQSDSPAPVKDIQLLIHGTHQSISDMEASVQIGSKDWVHVKDLFAEFIRQNVMMIKYEYLQSGVERFDGKLSPELLERDDWWTQLPTVRKMTREEISTYYGTSFSTGYAFLSLRASREGPTLDPSGTHAWVDIAIPLDDGTFSVISVGKYTEPFPETILETLHHIFRSHIGTLTVLDCNMFMSQRERMCVPFPPLSKKQFEKLMALLKEDFKQSINSELIFQAQGDNCAAWVASLIQRMYPSLDITPYKTAFQDLAIPAFLKPVFWAQHILPTQHLWNQFRIACSCALGALESRQFTDRTGQTRNVRLVDNPTWREGFVQVPSALFFNKVEIAQRISAYAAANPTRISSIASDQEYKAIAS